MRTSTRIDHRRMRSNVGWAKARVQRPCGKRTSPCAPCPRGIEAPSAWAWRAHSRQYLRAAVRFARLCAPYFALAAAVLCSDPLAAQGSYPDHPVRLIAPFAPGQESEIILGVLVPGATPPANIARLHEAIADVIALPDMRERLTALGFDPIGSTPAEFAARIKWEIERWARVIRAAGIKAQ